MYWNSYETILPKSVISINVINPGAEEKFECRSKIFSNLKLNGLANYHLEKNGTNP